MVILTVIVKVIAIVLFMVMCVIMVDVMVVVVVSRPWSWTMSWSWSYSQYLEELVLWDDPEDALCLVLVGLGCELAASGQWTVADDQPPLPTVVLHAHVVEPVGVALDDLDVVEIPGHVRLLNVHLHT